MLICANKTPEGSQKDSRKPVSVAGWPLEQNTGQAEIPSGQVQGIFSSIYRSLSACPCLIDSDKKK